METNIEKSLATDVYRFVLPKVEGTTITPEQVSKALGLAIAMLAMHPVAESVVHLELIIKNPPNEPEPDEDDEDEFEFKNEYEREYAIQRISHECPEDLCAIGCHEKPIPQWLKDEILKFRVKGELS